MHSLEFNIHNVTTLYYNTKLMTLRFLYQSILNLSLSLFDKRLIIHFKLYYAIKKGTVIPTLVKFIVGTFLLPCICRSDNKLFSLVKSRLLKSITHL